MSFSLRRQRQARSGWQVNYNRFTVLLVNSEAVLQHAQHDGNVHAVPLPHGDSFPPIPLVEVIPITSKPQTPYFPVLIRASTSPPLSSRLNSRTWQRPPTISAEYVHCLHPHTALHYPHITPNPFISFLTPIAPHRSRHNIACRTASRAWPALERRYQVPSCASAGLERRS